MLSILTGVITAILIITPYYIYYRLVIEEAVKLLERRRDHLLLLDKDKVKDSDINSFIKRVK